MVQVLELLAAAAALDKALARMDGRTLQQAGACNPYFTESNIHHAVSAIREHFLAPSKLQAWIARYGLPVNDPKIVGIVMAGNIPLVGFHDLLCVVMSGHRALVKSSHKDSVLMQAVIDAWNTARPSTIEVVEQFGTRPVDAIIATGSDNSARYFEYYFGSKPHIFRKNRNGVAILTGNESPQQLSGLADDIFLYFGLGCRSVSKLYLPAGFNPSGLFDLFGKYAHVLDCSPYQNNFKYQHAIHQINKEVFLTNGFVILKASPQCASPIAVLHYEFYDDATGLYQQLRSSDKIQCVVGGSGLDGTIPFGLSQQPQPEDYADGVDTMRFLEQISVQALPTFARSQNKFF